MYQIDVAVHVLLSLLLKYLQLLPLPSFLCCAFSCQFCHHLEATMVVTRRPCSDSRHVTAPYKLALYYYYYYYYGHNVNNKKTWHQLLVWCNLII